MESVRTTVEKRSVSQAVIETVAEAEGVDTEDLTPPLYDVVNPDALEQLFSATSTAGRTEGKVVFSYRTHEITVTADGLVRVETGQE